MAFKRLLILSIFILLLSPDGGASESKQIQQFADKVVTKKLSNGITLIMLDRGFSPTLAFEISFRVGSVDESYSTAGAAHLLEHMLFKGTNRIGTKDYSKERPILNKIEAVGETIDFLKLNNPNNTMLPKLQKKLKLLQAELRQYVVSSPYSKIYTENGGIGFNASTSRDKTGYYIQLPASKLELWARLESERLRNPVLREYYLERNNVIQERLMRYDSRGTGLLMEQFIATAYSAHPYRHPVIGWKTNIPFLSIRDIRAFYNTYYIPSRMTITIVGKHDVDYTFSVIKKYFGSLKTRKEPTPVTIKEQEQIGEKRFLISHNSNPYLMIGWHKPTFPVFDDYVLDVVSEVLSGGRSSVLYRSLVLEKKIASSINVGNGFPAARYNNLFVIMGAPRQGHSPEELEKAIYEEIEKAVNNLNDEDLKQVVTRIEADIIFGMATNKGVAHLLSYYQTVLGDWKYAKNYLGMINKVSVDDVRRTVKKYFTKRNRTVGILVDKRKENEISK